MEAANFKESEVLEPDPSILLIVGRLSAGTKRPGCQASGRSPRILQPRSNVQGARPIDHDSNRPRLAGHIHA